MKEILEKICKEKQISASALSNKLNSSRGFVKSVSYRKEDQTVYKLLALWPDLNPYWLITGEGPVTIDLESNSKIAKIGAGMADYKVLYDQLRSMYDDIVTENRHLESGIKKLMKQNVALIEENKSLKDNA